MDLAGWAGGGGERSEVEFDREGLSQSRQLAQWLDDLPSLVAGLKWDWSVTVGRGYEEATEAFVAEVIVDGGVPVVLKLLVPNGGDAASNEITVLRLADGVGCVRLLRHDAARGALLLERLGRSLHELAHDVGALPRSRPRPAPWLGADVIARAAPPTPRAP